MPGNARNEKRDRFNSWVQKMLWSRKWQPPPIFLPGKFHGQGSLAGYSPWGCKEPDTAERLLTHIQCIENFRIYLMAFRFLNF